MTNLSEAARAGLNLGRQKEDATPSRSSSVPPPEARKHTRQIVAASLAGGMIAASGKPHTAEEALAVFRDVMAALDRKDA